MSLGGSVKFIKQNLREGIIYPPPNLWYKMQDDQDTSLTLVFLWKRTK